VRQQMSQIRIKSIFLVKEKYNFFLTKEEQDLFLLAQQDVTRTESKDYKKRYQNAIMEVNKQYNWRNRQSCTKSS